MLLSAAWSGFQLNKTKTKVITMANYKGQKQFNEQIKTRRTYDVKRGKAYDWIISDWMTMLRKSYKPIVEHRNAKPRTFRAELH